MEITDDFGVILVQVPPGCFYMGSVAGGDDRPHQVCFSETYWIDKFEVTNAQYKEISGKEPPSEFSDDLNPVDSITWFDARDFCRLRGANLPTEAEWEYAARGPDSLAYPWGNEFDGTAGVYSRPSSMGHLPVMNTEGEPLRPNGASWVGAIDMSGNVWEWTNSRFDDLDFSEELYDFQGIYPYPYATDDGRESDETIEEFEARQPMYSTRVLRGGGFLDIGADLQVADRFWSSPSGQLGDSGFRCARTN